MQHTKILVVEDDAGLREALVDTLNLAQYQVIAADCAEQAMQLLSEQKIDNAASIIALQWLALHLDKVKAAWGA